MKTLKSDITQVRVTVRDQDGRITDYGGRNEVPERSGVIEKYTAEYVRIAGTYYSRQIYVFTR